MLITTTRGLMDEALLTKKTGLTDTDTEQTEWVEYWMGQELLHRSVHVRLKSVPSLQAEQGVIGG